LLQFRQGLLLNRGHLKEALIKKIDSLFSDLTFNINIPPPPPGYRQMSIKERREANKAITKEIASQQRATIMHLEAQQIYIYECDAKTQKYINKFHSTYIINAIGILFTGANARISSVMDSTHEQLSVPLLAVVCTLVRANIT
jgi:hypothetical protein